MIVEALTESDHTLHISDRIHTPEDFLTLDDRILHTVSVGLDAWVHEHSVMGVHILSCADFLTLHDRILDTVSILLCDAPCYAH